MTYHIEKTRNTNLEDTLIPNLFITDFMPDVPDGDFVKVYIYAFMCCRQGTLLTHAELAERLGLDTKKVLAAWKYFAERSIVRIHSDKNGNDHLFDVEFVDVKGVLYGGEKANGHAAEKAEGTLGDPERAALLQRIAAIIGAPAIDGADARRILEWLDEYEATPEIVERAWRYCIDERGEKNAKYIGKIVMDWTEKGLKTDSDIDTYLAEKNARNAVHKMLMEALGLRYSVITEAERKKFNLWLDEYGYTPDQLLDLADKTVGVGNKMKYLEGIIRKERAAEGKSTDTGTGSKRKSKAADRNDYYQNVRMKNEGAAAAKLEEIYEILPAVKETDDKIVSLNNELIRILTSGMKDKKSAVDRLNKEIEETAVRRAELLTEAGYTPDYTDIHYNCTKCDDTGIQTETSASCDCFI